MSKLTPLIPAVLLAAACAPAAAQTLRTRADAGRRGGARAPLVILDGTRESDGLRGPVRRVETEIVKVEVRQGQPQPQPPTLLERTLYDERGRRAQNETYPLAGSSRTGRESHRYDERGNVVETVVRDAAGAVLSRTSYEYEFDGHGNWTRMTASVAVSNQGRTEYEPFEITRRSITYYAVDDAAAGKTHSAAASQNGARRGVAPAGHNAPAVAAGEKVGGRARDGEGATAVGPAATTSAANVPKSLATKAPSGGEALEAGLLNARATWLPQPAYPVGNRILDAPYTVVVEVTLDITGRVVGARAQNGPAALRDSAERAARLAAFLPFYVSGRPVRARGTINYSFNYLP